MFRLKYSSVLKAVILTSLKPIFIFFLCSHAFSATLSIRADMFFPVSGNPYDDRPGYMIEVAQAILSEKGYTVDYQLMPWARSLIMAEKGLIDCVVGAYKSQHRHLLYPSHPWGKDQNLFYVAKDNPWRFKDIRSLQGIRVGLIHQYAYSDQLDSFARLPENSDIFEYTYGNNALEQNIAKLLAGRIDTTVETNLVMPEKLRELNLENDIVQAGALTPANSLYIACSPVKSTSVMYLQWFDQGIQRLRQSGKLQKILRRYQLQDWEQPKVSEKHPDAVFVHD
jgi:polar amino acid transport system substrate-binding protein